MSPPRVSVIGSGTLRPSGVRSSPCHLLEVGDAFILLDVGPGAVHGMARLGRPWASVSHVVLSHYHTDHIGDLPHLLFALRWGLAEPRSRPLEIIGPPGLEARVDHLAGAFGAQIRVQDFPLTYTERGRTDRWAGPEGTTISFHPTPHTDHSVAVRVQSDEWAFGYTGDTGPDRTVAEFLAEVDVLFCECGSVDPPSAPIHLSPRGVADLSRVARPRTLALTHVYPPLWPQEAVAQVRAAGWSGRIVAAEDGQAFPLGSNPVRPRPTFTGPDGGGIMGA